MIQNEMVWREQFDTACSNGDWIEIERLVDAGLRHRPGMTGVDFLKQWLRVGRVFGFATHDNSFGEFEKELAIIVRRMVEAESICRRLADSDETGKDKHQIIAMYREIVDQARVALDL